jgi:nicotinamide-nucleotide amidase
MIGEVIAIGDELTTGERVDTNSAWLAAQLGDLGVNVMYHTTVGDDLEANVQVFRAALERADVIVTSGGLGPTADDLTRQAWAKTLGVSLEIDLPSLEHIRALFARRQRPMPPANEIQAMFPQGTRPLENRFGTAPGIAIVYPRPDRDVVRAFSLPGVPAEMKEIWSGSVREAIASAQPERRELHHRRIKCFGVGESDLEAMLPDLIRRGREPRVGITVSQATITLRISAWGPDRATALAFMEPTERLVHECLGDLIFGYEDEELPHAVARVLVEQRKTLATLEYGSGGLISHWLNELPNVATFFRGGEVRSNDNQTQDSPSLKELEEGARQLQTRLQSDCTLAVGKHPGGTSSSAEPNQVAITTIVGAKCTSTTVPWSGHPAILKARIAKSALNLLRLQLLAATR